MFTAASRILGASHVQGVVPPPTEPYDPWFDSSTAIVRSDRGRVDLANRNAFDFATVPLNGPAWFSPQTMNFAGDTSSQLVSSAGTGGVLNWGAATNPQAHTMEAWIYCLPSAATRCILSSANGGAGFSLWVNGSNQLILNCANADRLGNGVSGSGIVLVPQSQWVHVAFVKEKNGVGFSKMYVNGKLLATSTLDYQGAFTQIGFAIGSKPDGTLPFKGYIDSIRVTLGARYLAEFTPTDFAGQTLPDPFYSSVYGLISFEGTSNAVAPVDVKGHTVTNSGLDILNASTVKFGLSCIRIAGTTSGSLLSMPIAAIGTQDFTIEGFVSTTTLTATVNGNTWFDTRPSSAAGAYLTLNYTDATGWQYITNGVVQIAQGASTMPLATWQHVAICRLSGVTRVFINGVQVGANFTDATSYLAGTLLMGSSGAALNQGAIGFLDETRITIGAGRYGSNFTPPATPFPHS